MPRAALVPTLHHGKEPLDNSDAVSLIFIPPTSGPGPGTEEGVRKTSARLSYHDMNIRFS